MQYIHFPVTSSDPNLDFQVMILFNMKQLERDTTKSCIRTTIETFLTASARAYQKHKRPFLFLLLIYMRFLTIFYAKTMDGTLLYCGLRQ